MQNHIPVLVLAGLGALSIIGVVVLGVADATNTGLETALTSIAVGAVGAIAGLVKSQPTTAATSITTTSSTTQADPKVDPRVQRRAKPE